MNILLHAAARGARIEVKLSDGEWCQLYMLPLDNTDRYRIHPDDYLLRYGPLSRVLFELAQGELHPLWKVTAIFDAARMLGIETDDIDSNAKKETLYWYCLMLAEELAHHGL